jgi:sulfide:quinone oxidoreductase
MKKICIIGAGTAGTMTASHLLKRIDRKEWTVTVFDPHPWHYYQPGFLFVPFGMCSPQSIRKPAAKFLPAGAVLRTEKVMKIDAAGSRLELEGGGTFAYDILVVATGCRIAPEQVEGMSEGWRKDIFDFYTYEGSFALAERLKNFRSGKVVVHLAEMPIKCPVAPLEFVLLADSFFRKLGVRDSVELTYVTPLSAAFTKKKTSEVLGHLLGKKKINLVTDFDVESVDAAGKTLNCYDGRKVPYDLLVTTPPNMGDELIGRSGMGDELLYVPTDKNTLQSKADPKIFVIGDATNLPTSKAGSVAHFESEVLTENIQDFIAGRPFSASFDGHANCFIESGRGKAFLLDFNYDHEPMEGSFPLPFVGPFRLLRETRLNHLGKLSFPFIYWNILLRGISLPFMGHRMSLLGKKHEPKTNSEGG